MTETLYDHRRVRLLTMLDEGNREGPGDRDGALVTEPACHARAGRARCAAWLSFGVRVDNGP